MLIVGIAGGSGSGKTTLAEYISNILGNENFCLIPQDAYYYDRSDISAEERRRINFDHPDSLEFSLLVSHLRQLKRGLPIARPRYSFLSSTRLSQTIEVLPKPIVLVEGILVLTHKGLRDMLDVKVFVDTREEIRLQRIISRDIAERGRDTGQVKQRFYSVVKPMHDQFILPSKSFADIIISGDDRFEGSFAALQRLLLEHLQDGGASQ